MRLHKIDSAVKWFVKSRHLHSLELQTKLKHLVEEFELDDVSELLPRVILKQFEARRAATAAGAGAAVGTEAGAAVAAAHGAAAPATAAEADDSDVGSESDEDEAKSDSGALKTSALAYMVLGKHMDVRRAVYKLLYEVCFRNIVRAAPADSLHNCGKGAQ